MARANAIVRCLAAGGAPAMVLAEVICLLVVKGAELGELEEYEIPDRDAIAAGAVDPPRLTRRGFRREWLGRLSDAIAADAFSRLPARDIVDRLLQPRR
ncbi:MULTISPECIES: hypothetical protein [unclassified Bradyrhizobium]|uniref:hypothetical protein n=1 Tax=unclassified Bradyrhizobium TaxID=2631580 RepID=UPI001BA68532|nr:MULTISPECIES: hypothetical protein [unclassified Bradyrhizobium]WLA52357.1 hypothetical protein QIH80_21055 [Bradyrhizobium elkanii]MBR1206977.1 hypothetical protein [Bradyrhizobium sp. AUGA SZCCT0124]MBR1313516.1 hypothetical protein [Bradyrhizobium sp. AUGA SZCCT0051]MBR1343387.1 hypothetical protein [Bradyrhizobium sp. AUGA SZCCT0105]MBR1357193.1 hypothetical protein [Bradyrhizobium sp. AUGA SZCCT0045]